MFLPLLLCIYFRIQSSLLTYNAAVYGGWVESLTTTVLPTRADRCWLDEY